MPENSPTTHNWFAQGGQLYSRFRPEYPQQLAAFLASVTPDTRLAVDVGCGNGQLTQLLAQYFDTVIGFDPSADQIANAVPYGQVHYQCASAECLPIKDNSVSLITAAQAAHWFDLPAFYREVNRVSTTGAIVALISYGVPTLESGLNDRFQHFYSDEIGPYWPAERRLVDNGYTDIDFPFEALTSPLLEICQQWSLAEFLGYLSTWSAVKNAKEQGQEALFLSFADTLSGLWGNSDTRRSITWPINMRIGRQS